MKRSRKFNDHRFKFRRHTHAAPSLLDCCCCYVCDFNEFTFNCMGVFVVVFTFVVIAQLCLRFHHHLFCLLVCLFIWMFFIFIKFSIDHADFFAFFCFALQFRVLFIFLPSSSMPVNLAERTKVASKQIHIHRIQKIQHRCQKNIQSKKKIADTATFRLNAISFRVFFSWFDLVCLFVQQKL